MHKPLKDFLVEYEDGDIIGKVLAWASMLPILFLFGTFAVTYVKRDFKSILFLAGQGFSLVVNKITKEIIQQPRPESEHNFKETSYGMPSNH